MRRSTLPSTLFIAALHAAALSAFGDRLPVASFPISARTDWTSASSADPQHSANTDTQDPTADGAEADATSVDRLRSAIAAAVVDRIASASDVQVDVLQAPDHIPQGVIATPAAGARLGEPIRFVLTVASGPRSTAVARVTAVVGHVVIARPLGRDVALTSGDVEWTESRVNGIELQPLPSLDDVLAGRTRRAMAQGEVVTRALISRPYAVRAGDTVAMTLRSAGIEVSGVGRAISSGFVGDVVRVTPPGSRKTRRARVMAPAAVESLK